MVDLRINLYCRIPNSTIVHLCQPQQYKNQAFTYTRYGLDVNDVQWLIMNLHSGKNSLEVFSTSASDTDFHPIFVGSLHLMLNPSLSSDDTVYWPFANLSFSPFFLNISVGTSYYAGLRVHWWLMMIKKLSINRAWMFLLEFNSGLSTYKNSVNEISFNRFGGVLICVLV